MTDSLEIQRILALARKSNASDIHIVANLPPLFRINGEIILADSPPLSREDSKRMCYSLMNDEQVKIFEDEWQICCSVTIRISVVFAFRSITSPAARRWRCVR